VPRARPIFPVALSLQSAAKAIGVPSRIISEAIYVTASLPAYRGPSNTITRILVRDLTDWIAREWPRATIKRHIERRKRQ
jgi:hypothetical protein